MEWVFALPEACNVAWGSGGVWLNKNDAFPPDDPFVQAHPEMFSKVPAKLRSTDGRILPMALPLTEDPFAVSVADEVRAVPEGGTIRRARSRG